MVWPVYLKKTWLKNIILQLNKFIKFLILVKKNFIKKIVFLLTKSFKKLCRLKLTNQICSYNIKLFT